MANLLQQSQPSNTLRAETKFYIKDLNGEWVDFSAKAGYGTDRLLKCGVISNKIEADLGALVTTIQNITLQNKDGFFDSPFPTSLKTVIGTTASFSKSEGYKRTILRGRMCKVCVQIRYPNEYGLNTNATDPRSVVQEEPLGYFFIENITPDVANRSVTLKLISQDGRLQDKKADGIRDGYDWYKYKPVSFLLERILESEFAENGALPASYNIDKTKVLDTLNDVMAVSVFGRPPLWDGTIWRNDGLYPRALWYGNVNSTGNRLYIGCDRQLWYYTPSTATYTAVDTTTIPSGYYIKKLFYDTTAAKLIIVAWEDEVWGPKYTAQTRTGWRIKIYTWNTGSLTEVTTGTVYGVSMSYLLYPSKREYDGTPNFDIYQSIGKYSGSFPGTEQNICIPFPQSIQFIDNNDNFEDGGPFNVSHSVEETGAKLTTTLSTTPTPVTTTSTTEADTVFLDVTRGWVSRRNVISGATADKPEPYACTALHRIGSDYVMMHSTNAIAGKKYLYFFRLKTTSGSTGFAVHEFNGTGLNDLAVQGTYTGTSSYGYNITVGSTGTSPDKFTWKKFGGTVSGELDMSTSFQSIGSEGLQVKWTAADGHNLGSSWDVRVNITPTAIADGDSTDTWGSTSPWFQIVLYSTDGTNTTFAYDVPSSSSTTSPVRACPTCMKQNGSATKAYVTWFQWAASGGGGNATVLGLDLTSTGSVFDGTASQMFGSETGDNLAWAVTQFEFFDSNTGVNLNNDEVVACLYNKITNNYVLVHGTVNSMTTSATFYTSSTKLLYSSLPFIGFCRDSVDDCVYCTEMGSGRVYKITSSGTLSVVNNNTITIDENGLLCNLTVNQSHTAGIPEIWGVTSPTYHVETFQPSYQSGKYVLFRITDNIADIVECANFEGMSKWEVIKQLVQSRDSIAFFDRQGNFQYKPRVYTGGAADFTLKLQGTDYNEIPIRDVGLDYGYDKVINVVKVQPYEAVFQQPDMNALTLIKRKNKNKKGKDPNSLQFVNYRILQKDTLAKKVIAQCVQAGTPGNGLSKWKYTVVQSVIEAIVNGAVASNATSIPLVSVFSGGTASANINEWGVLKGDFITVIDEATGIETTRTITAVTVSTNTLTINSSFGVALKDRQIVTIRKAMQKDGSYNKAEWSDEGVGYVESTTTASPATFTMTSDLPQPLAPGHIVRFSNDYHEYRITEKEGSVYTIERMSAPGTQTYHTTPSNGNTVFAYWSPNRSYPGQIGNTNVFVDFDAGTGTQDISYTEDFIPGDRFLIDCPGVILEANDKAVQVAIAGDSMTIHGKQELSIDNKFINTVVANELSKRILYYYANPKYYMKVTLPITPYIDLVNSSNALTVVDLYLPHVFLASQNFTEKFYINQIDHNTEKSETILYLVGLTAY